MIIQKFTKNLFSKYIGILALSFCLFACLAPESAALDKNVEKAFFWKVRSDTATVYLLGSLHLFKKSMYPLDPTIYEAYGKSDTLVVEVNMANIEEKDIAEVMQQKGLYTGADTLDKNLSGETLGLLKDYLKGQGMSLEQVNRMKPWFLNLTLSMQELMKLGYNPGSGIDYHFLNKATDKKTILELETLNGQLDMLAKGPKKEQDLALRLSLEKMSKLKELFSEMIDAWLNGDADNLINLEIEGTDKYPDVQPFIDRVYYDRNMEMAKKIRTYLKMDRTYFVVVGAFHMGGEKGIIKLLQDGNYTVKQLAKAPADTNLNALKRIPDILKSQDYDSFFPDGYESWRLYENESNDETITLGWVNKEEHELELVYKKASHRTIQNVYIGLGNEIDRAIKEGGGNLLKAEEYYALAMTNADMNMVWINILYGTLDGAYLWRYKVPPASKAAIDSFVKNLTYAARKEQYEKALASGNVIMGHWGKPVHEYARLLAEKDSPETETVYLNLLRTSSTNYLAHVEFMSITEDKKKILGIAGIVRKGAEDEKLLEKAASVLQEELPDINDFPLLKPEDDGFRVVLIPLTPVNPWILEDVAKTYESITTIPVSIRRLPSEWILPSPSRSAFRPQLERVASRLWPDKADFNNWSLEKLKDKIMSQAENEGPVAVSYVTELFEKVDKEGRQWDAAPLVLQFYESILPYMAQDRRTMYVGITDIDIYSGDSNFLFSLYGGSDSPVSILSCARMTAKMTKESQSSRRLIERCAKELVPASLKHSGIPRSVDPSCPYSYASGLQRLDEKTLKLSGSVMEQILHERGLYYHEKGSLSQAMAEYNKAIDLNPDFAEAYNNRGNIYFTNGEYNQAISDYQKAIERNSDNDKAFYNRGLAYKNTGETDKAISDFNKAVEINPEYIDAYMNRGLIYQSQGNIEMAISNFNRAVELEPNTASAYFNLGLAYYFKHNPDQAIENYSKAIKLNPGVAEAYDNRGVAYMQKGDLERALKDHDRAISLNSTRGISYMNRGIVYVSKGEFDLAFSDFNKALELDHEFAGAYNQRGIAYGRKGAYDLATSDFNRAIEIDPSNDEFYNNRGFTYMMKKEINLAIEDFDSAIEINPGSINAYINRGNAFYSLRNRNGACSDWGKACEQSACENYRRAEKAGYCVK